jgi:hypothetical protein
MGFVAGNAGQERFKTMQLNADDVERQVNEAGARSRWSGCRRYRGRMLDGEPGYQGVEDSQRWT